MVSDEYVDLMKEAVDESPRAALLVAMSDRRGTRTLADIDDVPDRYEALVPLIGAAVATISEEYDIHPAAVSDDAATYALNTMESK